MKKILALTLVLLLVFSAFPIVSLAEVEFDLSKDPECSYYNLIEKTDYKLAPGAVESEIVINDKTGENRNVVRVMEINTQSPNISLVPCYKNISETVDYTDKSNWGTQTVKKHIQYAQENLGLNVIGAMNASLTWDFNHPYGLLVYNGKLLYDGREEVKGESYLVIKKDGKAEFRNAYEDLKGDEWMALTICKYWLVKDGKSMIEDGEDHSSRRAPRSVLGIKADGTLVFMENDGRLEPYSAGFTNHEMAEIMIKLGCVEAVNCDGGGTSTFYTKRETDSEIKLRNTPSDGAERQTLTSFIIASTEVESDGVLNNATINCNEFVTAGSSVTLSATGYDIAGALVNIPNDVTWKLVDGKMGRITKSGKFTANNTTGTAKIQLVYKTKVIAQKSVYVVPKSTANLNGWVGELYYKNGVKYTGINKIDGYYYDFGENGVCKNKSKYTGLYKDGDVYKYLYLGEFRSGWNLINNEWYYFDETTYNAATGEREILSGIKYNFEQTGRLSSGVWVKGNFGYKYYYGPSNFKDCFRTIEGKTYYFSGEYRLEEGYHCFSGATNNDIVCYEFGENGALIGEFGGTGLITATEGKYYLKNGVIQTGLHLIDGNYYYFNTSFGYAYVYRTYNVTKLNGYEFTAGTYEFDENGIIVTKNGYYIENGVSYYYVNNVKMKNCLAKVGEDYYYFGTDGQPIKDKRYYAAKSSCELPAKTYYYFGVDGKALKGVIDGKLYVNGELAPTGLTKYGEDYYYSESGKVIVNRRYYAAKSNCELAAKDYYTFGADGKMLQGVVDGKLYIYGQLAKRGLVEYKGDYYYSESGTVIVNKRYYAAISNCELRAKDYYFFGADGKMLQGVIDGKLYIKGQIAPTGLTKYGEDYYYSESGKVIAGKRYYAAKTNCELSAKDYYFFGADGKMLQGVVDGKLYIKGQIAKTGLTKYGEDYYYSESGNVIVDKRYYAAKTNCELTAGIYYYFGADAKMLKGVVNGNLYIDGQLAPTGLTKYGEDYYYSESGKAVTGKYYVSKTNCDLPAKAFYYFGADSKMLNGVVNGYYYENGQYIPSGLTKIDNDYYYIESGKIAVGKYYASKTNCDLPAGKYYYFGEDGKILNGVVDGYCYTNGQYSATGLTKVGNEYYYVEAGKIITDRKYYASKTNCDLPAKEYYYFDTDGTFKEGVYTETDGVFYYESGKRVYAGLIEFEGNFYYAESGGKIAVNKSFTAKKTNCVLPINREYKSGPDGKIVK